MSEPTTEQLRAELERVKQQLDAANRREAKLRTLVEGALHAAKTDPSVRQGLTEERWQEAVKTLEAALQPDAGKSVLFTNEQVQPLFDALFSAPEGQTINAAIKHGESLGFE